MKTTVTLLLGLISFSTIAKTAESNQRVDLLEERPDLVLLYAGSPYAKEYNSPRGHQFAIMDVTNVLRTGSGSKALGDPGASCWSCKAPGAVHLTQTLGEQGFASKTFADAASAMNVSVGCDDCHQQGTAALALPRVHAQNADQNRIYLDVDRTGSLLISENFKGL